MLLDLIFMTGIILCLLSLFYFFLMVIGGDGTTGEKILLFVSIDLLFMFSFLFFRSFKINKIETKTYILSEKYTFNEDDPFNSMGIDDRYYLISFKEHNGEYIQHQDVSYNSKTEIRYKKDKENKIIIKYGINYYGRKLDPSLITICYKQK